MDWAISFCYWHIVHLDGLSIHKLHCKLLDVCTGLRYAHFVGFLSIVIVCTFSNLHPIINYRFSNILKMRFYSH